MKSEEVINKLSEDIRNALINQLSEEEFLTLTEIRLRVNKPIIVKFGFFEKVFTNWTVTHSAIERTMFLLTEHSLYAIEEDLKNGYFTISGGHRVGVCGRIVTQDGKVSKIREISSLNIRISKEIVGVSNKMINKLIPLKNTLIISPPACGKTTLLRDITRNLSNSGYTTCVIDERSEIAGSYRGVAQNDIGMRTDVLDCCPKGEGLQMALRTNAPHLIVLDELGNQKDIEALDEIFNCGVKVIATVHADSFDSFLKKSKFKNLISNQYIELYIELGRSEENDYTYELYDKFLENVEI